MRACGFCGNPDVSQEHVWADWLRKVILASRAEGGAKRFRAEIEREGKTISFQKSDLGDHRRHALQSVQQRMDERSSRTM